MNIVNIFKTQPIELYLYKQILTKLYSCYNQKDTRYEILKTDEQLNIIKNNDCYISVQFQGVAYILFFCIIEMNTKENKNYINKSIQRKKMNILIPKKDLKDTLEKNKNNEIKMFNIFLPFVNDEYYNNGTILDCKLIKTDNIKNKIEFSFVIHEMYYLPYKNMQLKEKYEIIEKDFLPKFDNTKCKYSIARLYEQNEIGKIIEKLPLINYKIIGLMFLFKTTRSYYVYTNETEFNLLHSGLPLPKHKTYNNSLQEFNMKSSKTTDVYHLYDINTDENIGLALIPNIYTSHYYKNIFKSEKIIKVQCIKSDKFLKWIPICNDCYDHILS